MPSDDRRDGVRCPLDREVIVCVNGHEAPARLRDVSCSGLCFSTNQPVPSSGELSVLIPCASEARACLMMVSGEIVWTHKDRVGVRLSASFADVRPLLPQLLPAQAAAAAEPEVVPHAT